MPALAQRADTRNELIVYNFGQKHARNRPRVDIHISLEIIMEDGAFKYGIWVISPSHSKNMLVLVKIAILQSL